MRTRTRSNRALLFYLILNIIVSAAVTLGVLFAWETLRGRSLPALPPEAGVVGGASEDVPAAADPTQAAPAAAATRTLPPPDLAVIEITGVFGAGDLNQEVVHLRRVGDAELGELYMAGWQLMDEGGNVYTFPSSPALVLYKDGGVQVFTRGGTDTATEIYWNRTDTVWEPTELITLLDSQGNVRATYRVP
jgi:hypothetical protein